MSSPRFTVSPADEAAQQFEDMYPFAAPALPERCERTGEWPELCDCVACEGLEENRAFGAVFDWQAALLGVGLIDSGLAVGREIAPKAVAS